MPLPWTILTRGIPARKARSTNFFHFAGGFVDGAADYVDFRWSGSGAPFVLQGDGDASRSGGFDGRGLRSALPCAVISTSAMSSRAMRIFMEPICTSK